MLWGDNWLSVRPFFFIKKLPYVSWGVKCYMIALVSHECAAVPNLVPSSSSFITSCPFFLFFFFFFVLQEQSFSWSPQWARLTPALDGPIRNDCLLYPPQLPTTVAVSPRLSRNHFTLLSFGAVIFSSAWRQPRSQKRKDGGVKWTSAVS